MNQRVSRIGCEREGYSEEELGQGSRGARQGGGGREVREFGEGEWWEGVKVVNWLSPWGPGWAGDLWGLLLTYFLCPTSTMGSQLHWGRTLKPRASPVLLSHLWRC